MIQYVGGIHARLQMNPLRGVERLRLRRNERVSPEVCCYACAGHDVFRVWINQWIPDGWIEARWIECVRRASVCCVRIIRVFHGPMYSATRRSSGTVDRQRLPRLCKKGGPELEPFTGRLTSRAIALAAASC